MHELGWLVNTLRPRQNGRHFPDYIFKCIFLNENVWNSTKISLNFVPKSPINSIPALVQTMAWHRPGDKPLSEPMMVSLLTHICVSRPQWVDVSDGNRGQNKTNNQMTLQWRHNERDGVSNHRRLGCLLNCLLRRRSKKTWKVRVTGFCEGNSPVTGEFPTQRASNAENASIWWRHVNKVGQILICTMAAMFLSVWRFRLQNHLTKA